MPRRPPSRNGSPPAQLSRPSQRIRWAREALGFSREALAALVGTSMRTIKRLENDTDRGGDVTLSMMLRVSYALGLAPSELWPGLHVRPPRPIRLAPEAVFDALWLGYVVVAKAKQSHDLKRPKMDGVSNRFKPVQTHSTEFDGQFMEISEEAISSEREGLSGFRRELEDFVPAGVPEP